MKAPLLLLCFALPLAVTFHVPSTEKELNLTPGEISVVEKEDEFYEQNAMWCLAALGMLGVVIFPALICLIHYAPEHVMLLESQMLVGSDGIVTDPEN